MSSEYPHAVPEAVLEALRSGAAAGRIALLLGQRWTADAGEGDPLAAVCEEILGDADLSRWWLAQDLPVAERATRVRDALESVVVPPSVLELLHLPWAQVYTSAIDSQLRPALTIAGRRLVHQIVGATGGAINAPATLPLVRLMGTVERESAAEAPPLDRRGRSLRRTQASDQLAALPALLGARGVLVVDGWSPSKDWLQPADLENRIKFLGRLQVVLCGIDEDAREELDRNDDIALLFEEGKVLSVPVPARRLFELVAEDPVVSTWRDSDVEAESVTLELSGRRAPADSTTPPSSGELVRLHLPSLDWRKFREVALIPVARMAAGKLPDSRRDRINAFIRFMAEGPGPSSLELAHRFAPARDAVAALSDACVELAGEPAPQESVLILRGPGGSGKSVALAHFTLRMRYLGFPVLYVAPSPMRVNRFLVDEFAQLVEAQTRCPTVLVHDANREQRDYLSLAEYFASRGRKVIVVGSHYTFQELGEVAVGRPRGMSYGSRPVISTRVVELSPTLSEREKEGLLKHLKRFIEDPEQLVPLLQAGAAHLFAVIYRALPEIRDRLEQGFLHECLLGARAMEESVNQVVEDKLGEEILRAVAEGDSDSVTGMGQASQDLLTSVMYVSGLGLQLPQSIALRLLGSRTDVYQETFHGGLLRERLLDRGSFVLEARHPLEAEIWSRKHAREREQRVALIGQLFDQISRDEFDDDYSMEVEFLVGLLEAVGPEGRRDQSLKSHWRDLAQMIRAVRSKFGKDISPRLLIKESNLLREWVGSQQESVRRLGPEEAERALPEFIEVLDSAQKACDLAIERVLARQPDPSPAARRLLATLETERAAAFGFQIGSMLDCLSDEQRKTPSRQRQLDAWLDGARQAWTASLKWNSSNHRAIDVACWTSLKRSLAGFADQEAGVELFAGWHEIIDRYEELLLTEEQAAKRELRVGEFREHVGDAKGIEALLERASDRGVVAVRAMLARRLAQEKGPGVACAFLREHCGDGVFTDPKLVYLHARLWWWEHTGSRQYFPRQRLCLQFDGEGWTELASIMEARLTLEPENSASLVILATAKLHLGRVEDARKLLRKADRLGTGGILRVKSLFLHCDRFGEPISHTAEFQGRRLHKNTCLAWSDELGADVEFFPAEHAKGELREGQVIAPFHLSVRFRGLFAEPTRRRFER